MPSSIVRLIRTDHDRLLRLLARALAHGPSQRRWRDEAVQLLRAHRTAEQELLTEQTVGRVTGASLDVGSPLSDLDSLDTVLTEAADVVAAPDAAPDAVADAGVRLREVLERHDDLTRQVLDPLQEAAPRKEIRALGGRYTELRDLALREQGATEPPPRRLDVSRAELYELARKAGIEGRSQMSRVELIQELMRRQGA